jgi:hypothetical protein
MELAWEAAVEQPYAMARDKLEDLIRYLQSGESAGLSHSELEREIETDGREILRALLQGYLEMRGPEEAEGPVLDTEGRERREQREHERALETVFGTVKVRRTGYGIEGAESLHPLDAQLNLPPERYSHEVRRRAAVEAARNSFDETVWSLREWTGAEVPKRQVEELVRRAAQDFDTFYQRREQAAGLGGRSGNLVVLTSDGKGVVMRRQDLREATRKAAEKKRRKLRRRLSKGEKRNAKRMATVAAVYTVVPFVRRPEEVVRGMAPHHEIAGEGRARPRPEHKRVWASLEKAPEEVLEEAFGEACKRDPKRRKRWVALVDGNETQLRILKEQGRKHGVELKIVLDVIHVAEYLWKAAHVFNAEATPELEEWVSERLLEILRGRASRVAGGIRRSATRRQMGSREREPADTCADYLLKYKEHLHYDEYLAAGFPIATGVIEGACRYLVKDRMDLTGARWSLEGAEAVLRLRALRASGDFDEYWHFHEEREKARNHASRYEGGKIPSTQHPSSPRRSRAHLKPIE